MRWRSTGAFIREDSRSMTRLQLGRDTHRQGIACPAGWLSRARSPAQQQGLISPFLLAGCYVPGAAVSAAKLLPLQNPM